MLVKIPSKAKIGANDLAKTLLIHDWIRVMFCVWALKLQLDCVNSSFCMWVLSRSTPFVIDWVVTVSFWSWLILGNFKTQGLKTWNLFSALLFQQILILGSRAFPLIKIYKFVKLLLQTNTKCHLSISSIMTLLS